jgi:hypothetical protein
MIDWHLIFSARFWFSLQWNPLQPRTAMLMAIFFAVLILVGIAMHLLPRYRKQQVDLPLGRALQRGGTVCATTGALGLFFTFTAYEQAGILSARFWFLALLGLFLGWGGWELWRAHILVPAEREAASIRERFTKYFPKARRK